MKGKQKLIKLKIIKPNKESGWWYNNHIGEKFEITEFAYYKNGANHSLNHIIKNIEDIQKCIGKYGNVHIHTLFKSKEYDGPHQIHLENTNWKILERKAKLNKIESEKK